MHSSPTLQRPGLARPLRLTVGALALLAAGTMVGPAATAAPGPRRKRLGRLPPTEEESTSSMFQMQPAEPRWHRLQ